MIYQVYIRSFADGNGDGVGDLAGVRARLPYLRKLGVDALWFNPWYASPMVDGGYDVADYRTIDPVYGTLTEAERLIAEARDLGLYTIVDIIPNHLSDQHPWFTAALAAEPGSPERERFWFRPGRGVDGNEPPNDWTSNFGGPAWTRIKNADGSPGEWYLHLFAPEQPDLNWNHPDIHREFDDILRFWFDRGAAGIRIDSAALLVKHPELPDVNPAHGSGEHPYTDREELHDIYRRWRALADSYAEPRALIGEIWLPDMERTARYLRRDELHSVFNFDFLTCPWEAGRLRACIDTTLSTHESVGAPASWVLSNHDVTRPVTRYGRADSSFSFDGKRTDVPTDLQLGLRRARAAAMLAMALPGSVYIYQGEELGLPEVEDIPAGRLHDPMHVQSGGHDPGRDGCRVPLPWDGTATPYGFSPADAVHEPWLPQPATWASLSVAAQDGDPASTLSLYRQALAIRRAEDLGVAPPLTWLDGPGGVLSFGRGPRFACVVNLSTERVALPAYDELLLTSAPLQDGQLPSDAAAWLRPSRSASDPGRGTSDPADERRRR